jgi:propionyl-CoA carboxylase alpha chain
MVESGDPVLVLEAMKMEHTIFSPATGTVAALNVATGDQVERGAVLAAVTETAE